MIAYLGDTRSRALVQQMETMRKNTGIGFMIVRGRLDGWLRRRTSGLELRWAYDNGAWADHVAGIPFDETTWLADLERIVALPRRYQPDFSVLPDIVAGGLASLRLSLGWLNRLGECQNWYLPVQDGMSPADIPEHVTDRLTGLFIGGSTDWKLTTMGTWRAFGSSRDLLTHVGRVGSKKRVVNAALCGVHSIDSSLPLFSKAHWGCFFAGLRSGQRQLFAPAEVA